MAFTCTATFDPIRALQGHVDRGLTARLGDMLWQTRQKFQQEDGTCKHILGRTVVEGDSQTGARRIRVHACDCDDGSVAVAEFVREPGSGNVIAQSFVDIPTVNCEGVTVPQFIEFTMPLSVSTRRPFVSPDSPTVNYQLLKFYTGPFGFEFRETRSRKVVLEFDNCDQIQPSATIFRYNFRPFPPPFVGPAFSFIWLSGGSRTVITDMTMPVGHWIAPRFRETFSNWQAANNFTNPDEAYIDCPRPIPLDLHFFPVVRCVGRDIASGAFPHSYNIQDINVVGNDFRIGMAAAPGPTPGDPYWFAYGIPSADNPAF